MSMTATRWRVEAGMEWRKLRRTLSYVAPVFGFPLVFYTIFGVVLAPKSAANAGTYLLATYSVFAAINAVMFGLVTSLSFEREHGMLTLRRLSPAHPASYLLSKVAAALLFALLVCVMLALVGWCFGEVRTPLATLVRLWLVVCLGVTPFALWALYLGLRLPAQSAANWLNLMLMPLLLLGGLWVPVFAFPGWLQTVSAWLPTYHFGQLALAQIGMPSARSDLMGLALTSFGLAGWWLALRAWRHHH
ncbi:MAG: ABC transporter permease [Xanthomonadales bacterium]|nr:ABC transporter permease [Xanthomonadales bacterium]MCB1612399.1 ABC transporter permease [Xanthomonadales bacterium]MCP5476471.1 ABC transporter permease [Rhodanobacteraceae bacterium]